MSQSGIDWKAKISTAGHLGGRVESATHNIRGKDYQEEVSAQYMLGAHKKFEVLPVCSLKLKLQRLEDFIADYTFGNEYVFVENLSGGEDGALTAYTLTMTNGLSDFKYDGCLTNKCSLTIPRSGSMIADLEIFGKTFTSTTFGSEALRTETVMDRSNVSVLDLASTDILGDFLSVMLEVNHGLTPEFYGNTTITPGDIFQTASKYRIVIERALKTQEFTQYAYADSTTTLDIQIDDNQVIPVKTLWSFPDLFVTDTKQVQTGLGMIIERIEAKGKSLELSVGT